GTVHAIGGGLFIQGGGLSFVQLAGSGNDQIYDGANVTISSGSLDLNGRNEIVDALSMQGAGYFSSGAIANFTNTAPASLTASSITLTGDATVGGIGNLTLNGSISGNFALTKTGAGTLTLTSNNTFTGGLTISQGEV